MIPAADPLPGWHVVAGRAVAALSGALGFEQVMLAGRQGADHVVLSSTGGRFPVGTVLPWSQSICAHVADGLVDPVTPDARTSPLIRSVGSRFGYALGCVICFPLWAEDGRLLGSLCALSSTPRGPELLESRPALEVLAATLAALLAADSPPTVDSPPTFDRHPGVEAAGLVPDDLSGGDDSLLDRRTSVQTRTPADTLLQELLDLARRQLGASVAFVGQWVGELRVMRALSSDGPLSVEVGAATPLDVTYCQRIIDGRLPQVIRDTGLEPNARALPVTAGIGSYVGVPVHLPDGQFYGTLCCLSPHPDASLTDRDADFLSAIAGSMARVLAAERRADEVRAALVARLQPLLRGESTTMVFQPVVSARSGEVVGSEALARFAGLPAQSLEAYFADAARVGRGARLELRTAATALTQAGALPGFLALNFSATTLLDPQFAELLAGVNPARIVVEVSEHERIDDYAQVAAVMDPLRTRGLRVAVDDAGAGFASLRHVVLLRPDILKLDISLVRGIDTDPTRQALAVALTTFAARTGTEVVAEGVETARERDVLVGAGVTLVQGWLTGAGVPAAEFVQRYGRASALPVPRRQPVRQTGR